MNGRPQRCRKFGPKTMNKITLPLAADFFANICACYDEKVTNEYIKIGMLIIMNFR